MENIVLLFICLTAGVGLRQTGRVSDMAHTALNAFVIHLSLPALILLQIHSVTLSPALLYAALMPWVLFTASACLFCIIGKTFRLPRSTIGALVVVGGLGNTSFVGLPMIEAFYGPAGLPAGIVIDQLGTYLVLSTVGIMLVGCSALHPAPTCSSTRVRSRSSP